MIPESGTPKELQAAWFEACAIPMVGEVYRVSPHGGDYMFGDIWHVKKVRKGKRKVTVVIDIYAVSIVSVQHSSSHKDVEMALYNWKRRYAAGEMRCVSFDIAHTVQHAWHYDPGIR
jgi:hypothetical protein